MGRNSRNFFYRLKKFEKEKQLLNKNSESAKASNLSSMTFDLSYDQTVTKKVLPRSKKKSENIRSLRKIKKQRSVVRQMFSKLPIISAPAKEQTYDIARDLYLEEHSKDNDTQSEEIYESRKLLIRQMQGLIAKEVHEERAEVMSEYDSWSDLETNFAMAYEPVPLHIKMDAWKSMSKKDILQTVKSNKLKKEFEYMSHSEILGRIEMMQKSARYLSVKFGVDKLLSHLQTPSGKIPEHNHPPLHMLNEDGISNFYVTRSEVLKDSERPSAPRKAQALSRLKAPSTGAVTGGESNYIEMRDEKFTYHANMHDSWSSRASSIINNPESMYKSRLELLKTLDDDEQSSVDSWSSVKKRPHVAPEDRHFMSRGRLINKIVENYDSFCTTINDSSSENDIDSETSGTNTVKNVVLVNQTEIDSSLKLPADDQHLPEKNIAFSPAFEDESPQLLSYSDGSECSCSSCNTLSDCSCFSHSASESVNTVVRGSAQSDDESFVETKHRDKYVVNQSHSGSSLKKSGNKMLLNSEYDPLPKAVVKQSQLMHPRPNSAQSVDSPNIIAKANKDDSWSNSDFEKLYVPIDVTEIKRQSKARAFRKYLKAAASEWDSEINDLNTLRRNRVIKELRQYLKNTIDLVKGHPDDIEVALREALDAHFEAVSNLSIGQMYVPMENNPTNSKAVSRENTDYDTFGSIDSLIFEPKTPPGEDTRELEEEIKLQFEYLDQISSVDEHSSKPSERQDSGVIGAGKTTFAERVKLFQTLGKDADQTKKYQPINRPMKKVTQLEIVGQETTWKEVAVKTVQSKGLDAHFDSGKSDRIKSQLIKLNTGLEAHSDSEASLCPECAHLTFTDEESTTQSKCYDCCNKCNGCKDGRAEGSDELKDTTVTNDVITQNDLSNALEESNLRRMLKESFGASAGLFSNGNISSIFASPTYGFSEVENNLEVLEDFICEHAKKQSSSVEFSDSMQGLTSSNFVLKLADETPGKDGKQVTNSDSGISSPPLNDSSILHRSIDSVSDYMPMGNDSEDPEKIVPSLGPSAPIKKRDTMIRELKSKLREKFQADDLSMSALPHSDSIRMKANEQPTKKLENSTSVELSAILSNPKTREIIYGPGGIFGPKGPFSTPDVRYPHGMDVKLFGMKQRSKLTPPLSRASRNSTSSASDDRAARSPEAKHDLCEAAVEVKSPSRMKNYMSGWGSQELDLTRHKMNQSPGSSNKAPRYPHTQPGDLKQEKVDRTLAWISSNESTSEDLLIEMARIEVT